MIQNPFRLNFILKSVEKQELEKNENKNEEKLDQEKDDSNKKFFDELSDNYIKRTDEIDHFSKHSMNSYVDLNTEFLYGSLNTAQHYIDIQKKYSDQFPIWYLPAQMQGLVKQNTDFLVHIVENADSVYAVGLKFSKNYIKMVNNNFIRYLESFERLYELLPKSTTKDSAS